ncbi:DNA glycosylase [Chaetomium sp. MPI-SDFR-AT-0129]|nr:DNA glycosylase [Chaetomium sp. MPI-SDFR-AT-0129]
MRATRAARETSRYFDATSSPSLPRRSTRSTRANLARFAYNGANGANGRDDASDHEDGSPEVKLSSDIEDAVQPATTTRKRKRPGPTAAAATAALPRPTPRRNSPRFVKPEVKSEEIKSEDEAEEKKDIKTEDSDAAPTPRARGRVRKPARRVTDAATGTIKTEPPSDWEEIYALVKQMRLTGPAANAAVDTMGCERLARPDASARDRRFHTLVALMLSSQTKDTVNAEAMARLQTELPPCEPGKPAGLNLENMLAVEPAVLNELIGKVGFHNNKTKYLKQTALLLQSQFDSDIPRTIEGLTSLPGVGPKMAHLCMSATHGWNTTLGIGVDVHVHRITNLWGWNGATPSRNPEETRHALESWLPRDKWKEINWLLVGLGQTVCLPIGRKCGDCEVGLKGLCKSAERGKVLAGRKKREERGVVKKEEVVEVDELVRDNGVKGEEEEEDIKVLKKEEADVEMTLEGPAPEHIPRPSGPGNPRIKEEPIDVDMADAEGLSSHPAPPLKSEPEPLTVKSEPTPVKSEEDDIQMQLAQTMAERAGSADQPIPSIEKDIAVKKEEEDESKRLPSHPMRSAPLEIKEEGAEGQQVKRESGGEESSEPAVATVMKQEPRPAARTTRRRVEVKREENETSVPGSRYRNGTTVTEPSPAVKLESEARETNGVHPAIKTENSLPPPKEEVEAVKRKPGATVSAGQRVKSEEEMEIGIRRAVKAKSPSVKLERN